MTRTLMRSTIFAKKMSTDVKFKQIRESFTDRIVCKRRSIYSAGIFKRNGKTKRNGEYEKIINLKIAYTVSWAIRKFRRLRGTFFFKNSSLITIHKRCANSFGRNNSSKEILSLRVV
ncbi:uncharacterized protein LOC143152965 [Ptiloglossa arizonensis]|uniref:uncharacterized protein LOC143152965 n=1 Tax=Ptiloglossa arizonensis TaxID=3350558 RepID=UPI003F9F1594